MSSTSLPIPRRPRRKHSSDQQLGIPPNCLCSILRSSPSPTRPPIQHPQRLLATAVPSCPTLKFACTLLPRLSSYHPTRRTSRSLPTLTILNGQKMSCFANRPSTRSRARKPVKRSKVIHDLPRQQRDQVTILLSRLWVREVRFLPNTEMYRQPILTFPESEVFCSIAERDQWVNCDVDSDRTVLERSWKSCG
jgi:hypothetical protein